MSETEATDVIFEEKNKVAEEEDSDVDEEETKIV